MAQITDGIKKRIDGWIKSAGRNGYGDACDAADGVLFGVTANGFWMWIVPLNAQNGGSGLQGIEPLEIVEDRFTRHGTTHMGCRFINTRKTATISVFFNDEETRRWCLFWRNHEMPPVLGASAS